MKSYLFWNILYVCFIKNLFCMKNELNSVMREDAPMLLLLGSRMRIINNE